MKKIRKPVVIKQFKMKKKKTLCTNQGVFLEPCIEINSCKRIRGSGAADMSEHGKKLSGEKFKDSTKNLH